MKSDLEFKYDVFISYRWVEPDQSWVRQQLAPALTKAGLKVCLDVNDFIPGRDLFEEMKRAGTKSRHGICVISPDYFAGDRMVDYERRVLMRSDPAGTKSRLIPLVFRKTEIPEPTFGLTSVDWTDSSYHRREWEKLLRVLGGNNLNAPDPESFYKYKDFSYAEIELLNILAKYSGFGMYLTPRIPPDMLAKTKKACKVSQEENILCLIELGLHKEYLLLGSKGVYLLSYSEMVKRVTSMVKGFLADQSLPSFKLSRRYYIKYSEFTDLIFDYSQTRGVSFGNGHYVLALDIKPYVLVDMLNDIKEAILIGRLTE